MARGIVKLADDFYVEWSTVVDAPVTYGMTRKEMFDYIVSEYNTPKEGVESRMARVDANGTSFYGYENANELISFNKAGPNESCLTLAELIAEYTYKYPTPPQSSPEDTIQDLQARIKVLEEALQEIARPARGGIEANDSDEDWIDYLVEKCNKYQALARGALQK